MSELTPAPQKGFFAKIGKTVGDGVRALWQARRSPSPAKRVAWWSGCLAAITLILAPERGPIALALWICLNCGLVCVSSVWSLLHPRCVWRAKRTVTMLALIMSLFALSLLFPLPDLIASHIPAFSVSGSALLLGGVCLFPIALLVCVFMGLTGAGIGAFAARRETNPVPMARSGVVGFWIAIWCSGILAAQGIRPLIFGTVLLSAPMVAYLAALLIQKAHGNEASVIRRVVLFLDHRLQIRYRSRQRARILDLRGIVLGLLAGLFVLTSGLMGIFTPLQARLLAAQLAFRSAPLLALSPSSSIARVMQGKTGDRLASNFVVLHLDEETRNGVLHSGSEAAIQARMIRLLTRYHCRLIVLPAPILDPNWQSLFHMDTLSLPINSATITRSQHDLPELKQAMRQAGNVLLAVPNTDDPMVKGHAVVVDQAPDRKTQDYSALRSLAQSAVATGNPTLGSLDVSNLPTIPLGWTRMDFQKGQTGELPSLPLVLLSAQQHTTLPSAWKAHTLRPLHLGALTLKPTVPGQILVSYFAGAPNAGFPTLSYEMVFDNGPETLVPRTGQSVREDFQNANFDRDDHKATPWIRLEDVLRDKVVLLQGIDPEMRQTPIGNMTTPELMAHAVTTLATGSIIHRAFPQSLGQVLLTSLLLAAIIGQITLKRTPLQAGWWSLLIASLFVVGCLLGFLFLNLWIDVLLPLMSSLAAYILTLQYADTINRWDMSRNRAMLERFLDKDTVDRIMKGEELKLGGEKKTICVLFADVRGFSRFASQNPPEEVLSTINAYLTAMSEQVFRHDGFLDKFLGDGMLALFGIPNSQPDDVERAVRAALAMQEAATRISQRMVQEGRQPLGLGIGLHYGEAVFGLVGNIQRPDPTAIGHTVVLAQRIQGTAQAGEIVVSEAVHRQLGFLANAQAREPVQLKGLADPVPSYRLLGLRSAAAVVAATTTPDESALLTLRPRL